MPWPRRTSAGRDDARAAARRRRRRRRGRPARRLARDRLAAEGAQPLLRSPRRGRSRAPAGASRGRACARSRCPRRRGRARRRSRPRGRAPRGPWRSRGREHGDGGAVLVVVQDRHLEAIDEPPLDLEADRRLDVLEPGSRRSPRDALHGLDDGVGVAGCRARSGRPERPTNWWSRAALPSITGSEATGPTFPRPSTRVPLVTMATVFPRMV